MQVGPITVEFSWHVDMEGRSRLPITICFKQTPALCLATARIVLQSPSRDAFEPLPLRHGSTEAFSKHSAALPRPSPPRSLHSSLFTFLSLLKSLSWLMLGVWAEQSHSPPSPHPRWEGPGTFSLAFCCRSLEFLNSWTRGPTSSFCTAAWKVCSLSWA